MTTTLSQASTEWATRPADESYTSLEELHTAVQTRRERAKEAKGVRYADLRVEASRSGDSEGGASIKLIGKADVPADLTHWSFGQLSRAVNAPAHYLRTLPATLAAQNLNHGLAHRGAEAGQTKLLLDVNGTATVRALTGPDYSRIWDADITARLMQLPEQWQPAPETQLVSGASTRGLYASDHDVFAFLIDNDRRIFETAPGGGLSRGFMVANSEVGDKAFWLLTFLYSFVCANHNVWGVEGVRELRIRHTGQADARAFRQLSVELRRYAEASSSEDEAKIHRCMAHQIAASKDELLDTLFGMRSLGLSRKVLAESYSAAERHSDWYGSPRSAWGIGNGISEVAQAIPHTDERVKVERAAGRVFAMAF